MLFRELSIIFNSKDTTPRATPANPPSKSFQPPSAFAGDRNGEPVGHSTTVEPPSETRKEEETLVRNTRDPTGEAVVDGLKRGFLMEELLFDRKKRVLREVCVCFESELGIWILESRKGSTETLPLCVLDSSLSRGNGLGFLVVLISR